MSILFSAVPLVVFLLIFQDQFMFVRKRKGGIWTTREHWIGKVWFRPPNIEAVDTPFIRKALEEKGWIFEDYRSKLRVIK